MAPPQRPRRRTGEFGGGRKFTPRRKVCAFCVDKIKDADYKDVGRLRRFLSERGKIEPRRKTGTCAAHQRSLNVALKRARHLALLPFTAEHIRITGVLVREPGSGMRDRRPPRPGLDGGGEPTEAPAPSADGSLPAPAPATNGAEPGTAATAAEPVAPTDAEIAPAEVPAPAAPASLPA